MNIVWAYTCWIMVLDKGMILTAFLMCQLLTLEVREHRYIQLLKTLKPLGINTVNPFGLPLLQTY